MRHVFVSILSVSFVTAITAQPKGLELQLSLINDRLESLQPLQYCMSFANISEDTIAITSFPWEYGKVPTLEIKSPWSFKWKRLHKSWIAYGQESEYKTIYGPLNCWVNPYRTKKISPHSHYCQAATYFPVWQNSTQYLLKPGKKYKIRLAVYTGDANGVIRSKPKVIYVKKSKQNDIVLKSLLENNLNTEHLYNEWSRRDTTKSKFIQLRDEYPSSDIANWITFQELKVKFREVTYGDGPSRIEKNEAVKSLLEQEKALVEKMLHQTFYPKNIFMENYLMNVESSMNEIGIDSYFEEIEWLSKITVQIKSSCDCQ